MFSVTLQTPRESLIYFKLKKGCEKKKMEKNAKSVSKLLDKAYGKISPTFSGKRGKILHEAYSRIYKKTFKIADRNKKTNYRVFSQRISKAIADILADIRKNKDYELYYEDAKILLQILQRDIIKVAKAKAKNNYQVIIPREVEIELFDGEASFEIEAEGKIGSIRIPARVDCLIEKDSGELIVRDFKSYELDSDKSPISSDSQDYREFMQVCLYAIVFEQVRYQRCTNIQLVYFPNNLVSFDFTEEFREKAIKFALDTAFEGFEGIAFDFINNSNEVIDETKISKKATNLSGIPPEEPHLSQEAVDGQNNEDCLGWLNTIPGKPLKILRGKPNKLEGYLYPKSAHQVRENSLLKVETDEGTILGCKVEKIECFEESASTVTKTHKEESYKITLNPEIEITPEGCCDVRPQTIISGKIKKLNIQEFYLYKKIPQNGMAFGTIEGLLDKTPYQLSMRAMYQSCFVGGVQNTGKTSSLRYLIMLLAQQQNAPAQIIFDAEEEYLNLINIPTNQNSRLKMLEHGVKTIESKKYEVISFGGDSKYCLTLKDIDLLDLPLFLHELTSITHSTLQRIIKDILTNNKGKNFTFPELKQAILRSVDLQEYRLNSQTKSAIERALMPISLDLFDKPNYIPIDIKSTLESGKITVLNCFDANDEEQRIIALFLLCALHKHKMKKRNIEYDSGVLFYLDEVQRLLPKLLSNLDNQKRIVHYLGEIHHRGRKRKYGVIYATQSPLDIKKEIIDLCNTKIFFQIQGDASNLLKEYLGKEERERLKQLPTGQAFITSKGEHDPVEIKFPYLK